MAYSDQQAPTTAASGGRGNSSTGRTATKRKATKSASVNYRDPQKLAATISSVTSTACSFLRQNDVVLLPSQTLILESLLSSTSLSLTRLLSLLPRSSDPLSLSPIPPLPCQPQCWFYRFLSSGSADYSILNEEDSFSSVERAFNSAHNQAMGSVVSAFGRLRARWQLLSKQWKEECVEYLPFVIVTGCLLHNFLIKCDESVAEEFAEPVNEEGLPVYEGVVDEGAQRIRDALALHMSRANIER
ncbi:hypothetical protein K1719_002982 [Acacia pycnantha]|nr:hypothetical protein K1719_002982 [Acacia pycnantha]